MPRHIEKPDQRLELANRIIERIEQGTAPWQRPWEAGEVQTPTNAVTGNPYHGVNYQNLMMFSPDPGDNRWCTYNQAKDAGWQIKKGEHGVPIEKWMTYEKKMDQEDRAAKIDKIRADNGPNAPVNDAETERRMSVKHYTVFHASQIEGIPQIERKVPDHELEGQPDPRLNQLAQEMGVTVDHESGRAAYRPGTDTVRMPTPEAFERAVEHDSTFLHELSHATGHESRLDRDLQNSFGSQPYAIEELRAEMSAAMSAASLGIGFDPASQDREEGREVGNSAAYLASWLKDLPDKDRKEILMDAIKDAQKISDYLIERTPELTQERQGRADKIETEKGLVNIPSTPEQAQISEADKAASVEAVAVSKTHREPEPVHQATISADGKTTNVQVSASEQGEIHAKVDHNGETHNLALKEQTNQHGKNHLEGSIEKQNTDHEPMKVAVYGTKGELRVALAKIDGDGKPQTIGTAPLSGQKDTRTMQAVQKNLHTPQRENPQKIEAAISSNKPKAKEVEIEM
jgi:antirestriction protein ArdC